MRKDSTHSASGNRENEVDLYEIIQLFWYRRIFIGKVIAAFILLSLFIAVFSPVEYETNAVLLPETQSAQSQASTLLQQYGGLLGIGGANTPGSGVGIPPQLYPNIVQSIPFQIELMNAPVQFSTLDTTASSYGYFTDIHTPSVLGYIKSYTLDLPGKIISFFRDDGRDIRSRSPGSERDSILTVSYHEMEIVENLRQRVTVSFDEEAGVINIISTMPDPQAAAEVGQTAIRLLKKYMREYQTQKALEDLEFVRGQTDESRERFEEIRLELAEFRDRNVGPTSNRAQTREQELQAQYDLAFNLYNSLNQQLEQAKIKVQEQTPVFSVLQPIHVPLGKSSPKRMLILISFAVFGGIAALSTILIQNWWKEKENTEMVPSA